VATATATVAQYNNAAVRLALFTLLEHAMHALSSATFANVQEIAVRQSQFDIPQVPLGRSCYYVQAQV
jgi:hypothetical protein